MTDPELEPGDRRTAVVAVLVVLAVLGGLSAWVAVGDPTQNAGRSAPAAAAPTGEVPEATTPTPVATGTAQPVDTSSPLPTPSAPTGPLAGVDWNSVAYPVACGGAGVVVQQVVMADVTLDSAPDAVVSLHCDAGAGSPPSAIVVYTGREGSAVPDLLATLLRPGAEVQVGEVSVEGSAILATGTAYSSGQVPRCCPDRTFRAVWRWAGSGFRRAD